jgi:hypothetical protein
MMKRKGYRFKEGSRLDNRKATAVGKCIEAIEQKHKRVTAERVVKEARNAQSPLHGFFEWDNTKAAKAYRLEQARHMIRSVVVVWDDPATSTGSRVTRAFLSLRDEDDSGGKMYMGAVRAMSDARYRKQLLAEALAEAEAWRQRYKDLEELAVVFKALDKVKKPRKRKK